MTSFKFLGATLVLSALLAAPASAWEAISEPAAAAAQDPTFSIYSNDGRASSVRWPRRHRSATRRECICRYGRIEMALNVLAYNLTRVMNIVGIKPLQSGLPTWRPRYAAWAA
jgi:hypothetical protein